jgi:prevent-host-death family protein
METVSISEFKATCLKRIERVRRTGQRLVITKRGKPVAEVVPPSQPVRRGSWLGIAKGTGRITGDIISPVVAEEEWEVLRK